MGTVFRGIPERDAAQMAQLYGCVNYVETGTHVGKSLAWAVDSRLFQRCIGIEIDSGYAAKTIERVGLNAHVLIGDSVQHLPQLAKQLNAPTFFWLDAHWSPDLTWEEPRVICPLLDELRIIAERPYNDVVFIDDARLLGTGEWPSVVDLLTILIKRYSLTIIDDYVKVLPKK